VYRRRGRRFRYNRRATVTVTITVTTTVTITVTITVTVMKTPAARRPAESTVTATVAAAAANAARFTVLVKRYIGGGFRGLLGRGLGNRRGALDSPEALGEFIQTRASHVAQTALYGYMKTRAGTRFPALFEDPAMLASINIAKWHVWAACVSDLAVYCGVLLRIHGGAPAEAVRAALAPVVAQALAAGGAGAVVEAGDAFADALERVRRRVAGCDFDALGDDASAFSQSPRALVYWAPIADELKARDAAIVQNSIKFKWQEVRRDLRRRLRAPAVLAAAVAEVGESTVAASPAAR